MSRNFTKQMCNLFWSLGSMNGYNDFGGWCHADCLKQSVQAYICVLCQTYFVY